MTYWMIRDMSHLSSNLYKKFNFIICSIREVFQIQKKSITKMLKCLNIMKIKYNEKFVKTVTIDWKKKFHEFCFFKYDQQNDVKTNNFYFHRKKFVSIQRIFCAKFSLCSQLTSRTDKNYLTNFSHWYTHLRHDFIWLKFHSQRHRACE